MNATLSKALSAFVLTLICATVAPTIYSQTSNKAAANADVKIRQKMTSSRSDRGAETLMYIKGPRMRNEIGQSTVSMTTIVQCDLKRTLMINDKTKTYMVVPDSNAAAGSVAGGGGGAPGSTPDSQSANVSRGGVVNVTNTITDTGERKEMFGFTARHIKTSTVRKASPDACEKDLKLETDGWYIDFQYAFDCPSQMPKHQAVPVQPQPGCKDEVRTKTVGTAKLGFPLLVTTTIFAADGTTSSVTQEVLELSRQPLQAALFEVPEGYALAKDMQELYGMNVAASSPAIKESKSNSIGNSAGASSVTENNSASVTSATSPKKPGAIRIGMILPKVQMTAGDTARAAEALRTSFANYLNSPTIEVVSLESRLPSLAMNEARQSQCDYVLFVSMVQKKGGGGGMFGRALGGFAGAAAGHIPGGGNAGTGAARSVAVTGVYTSAHIAGSIKAKDEVGLEHKLEPTDGARQGVSATNKAKASRDGEDVVTPLIEKAAENVVATVSKK
jgi:hypothetical protein